MRKIVYLIDDDLINLHLLKRCIANQGYEVIEDLNGDKLDLSLPFPSIYLIDINLEGKNGIELCKIIKGKKDNVPVILMSSNHEMRSFIGVCLADAFLPKPIKRDQMIETITKYAL